MSDAGAGRTGRIGGQFVIQGVLFDMHGAVIQPVSETVTNFLAANQVGFGEIPWERAEDPLWDLYKCGGMDEASYGRARHVQLGTPRFR